jgi:predicted dehydrogenase
MMNDFEPLRVALIGCGGMGARHAKAVVEMHALGCRPVHIVAVCDPDEQRRAKIAALVGRQYGETPRQYADYRMALDQPDIEGVDIVLPTSMHHTVVLAAIAAGKHVLVEKPLALTVSACDLIVEASSKSNTVVAVAENYRRIPHNRAIKALLQAKAFGEVDVMFVRNFASPEPPVEPGARPVASPNWYRDRTHVGGYHAMEMGVHEADLQSYWFGPIQTVSAEMESFGKVQRHNPNASEDMLAASLRFADGMVSHVSFCSTIRQFEVTDRTLIGRNAVVTSHSWHAWLNGDIQFGDGTRRSTDQAVSEWLAALSDSEKQELLPAGAWTSLDKGSVATDPLSYGVGLAIYDFARAARMDRHPEITVELARRAVATCCAIWESAHLQTPVSVDQVLTGKIRAAQSSINAALGLAA